MVPQWNAACEQLDEERFAEGERTMSEVELPNVYEPAVYVATLVGLGLVHGGFNVRPVVPDARRRPPVQSAIPAAMG